MQLLTKLVVDIDSNIAGIEFNAKQAGFFFVKVADNRCNFLPLVQPVRYQSRPRDHSCPMPMPCTYGYLGMVFT
jgi:hypothetical protein